MILAPGYYWVRWRPHPSETDPDLSPTVGYHEGNDEWQVVGSDEVYGTKPTRFHTNEIDVLSTEPLVPPAAG